MSVRFSRMLGRTSEDSTEDGFKWKFRDILAQNYIIWMICTMLAVKHFFYHCNQGIVAKYSNLECKCSIAMIMMHPRDGWLQWWCNTRMECSMCKWNGAYDTMHLPWCWPNDAYTMMQWWQCSLTYACRRGIKYDAYPYEIMMHTVQCT